MKKSLHKKEQYFRGQFGFVPTFKAGIHYGKVTAGEIGAIKKDIMYTGDVLNAAARIQALCNVYGVDLLVSGDLRERLELGQSYEVNFLGEGELKGKEEKKKLYNMAKAQAQVLTSSLL